MENRSYISFMTVNVVDGAALLVTFEQYLVPIKWNIFWTSNHLKKWQHCLGSLLSSTNPELPLSSAEMHKWQNIQPFRRKYYCRAHSLVAEKYFKKYSKKIPENKFYSKTSNTLRDLNQRNKLSWELCQQGRCTCSSTASYAFYTFFFIFLHISCVHLLDLTNIYYLLLQICRCKVDVFRFAQKCTHLSLHWMTSPEIYAVLLHIVTSRWQK